MEFRSPMAVREPYCCGPPVNLPVRPAGAKFYLGAPYDAYVPAIAQVQTHPQEIVDSLTLDQVAPCIGTRYLFQNAAINIDRFARPF
jgi:hypothetical protein